MLCATCRYKCSPSALPREKLCPAKARALAFLEFAERLMIWIFPCDRSFSGSSPAKPIPRADVSRSRWNLDASLYPHRREMSILCGAVGLSLGTGDSSGQGLAGSPRQPVRVVVIIGLTGSDRCCEAIMRPDRKGIYSY